ncbi:MAG: Trk system potassium transporter TrkA [Prevotellaceae bacterium]|nr:Trk system potassium transporter TrkA [Candidatus Minthosoma caballi]
MKIIIAGAGAVGTHLARLLSKDNMDVVLMDENQEKLARLNSDLDIMTIAKSPTSIQGLKDAGVAGTDLFIAVTPHESENLACAMLAKQLGAKKTVARVDNYEYMKPENQQHFKQMGIESLIYPELLAAQDIAASAKYSWVRQLWEFNGGQLLLLSVMMHDAHPIFEKEISNKDNQLIGHTLKEIGIAHGHSFHVVAIKRQGETVIPYGDEKILPRDLVFFMTTKEGLESIRHLSGKDSYPSIKNCIIIGGGKLSVRTDWMLNDNHQNVKIIESDNARCQQLGSLVTHGTLVVNGEGYDMDLLNDEGFGSQEAFISLTNNDQENILACIAARRRGIKKTIAQVENLDYFDMATDLDVGTMINKKVIAASHIYRMLLKGDVDNMKMLTVASADVAEFIVKAGSKVTRKPVMDLGIPRGVNIGGMSRDGKSMLVSGRTQLQEGDKVVVFCMGNTLRKLDKFFR